MHLPFIVHACAYQMYMKITCTRLNCVLLDSKLTVKCIGRWCCERTAKNELHDPRGSLANDIPSYAIVQAIQKVWQDDPDSTLSNI